MKKPEIKYVGWCHACGYADSHWCNLCQQDQNEGRPSGYADKIIDWGLKYDSNRRNKYAIELRRLSY